MEIIETSIIGKGGADKCEDAYVITETFVTVVDGSTSKSSLPPLKCNRTHGQIAADCVCDYVRSCPPDIDMVSFCEQVTEKLRVLYPTYRPTLSAEHFENHPEDRFTCSAIVYSAFRQEIWMIGDCHCLLIKDGSPSHSPQKETTIADIERTNEVIYHENDKPSEAVLAARRAEHIERMLANGASVDDIRKNDEGRAAIIADLKASMKAQNKEYAVIDGFSIPTDKVKVINTLDASEIILATDGYPHLFPTLSASEQDLSDILTHDPLLIRRYQATKCWHPDNKSFDDRCYIRLKIR